MKNNTLPKLVITLIVLAGFTVIASARAPRPGSTIKPPTPISGL